MSAHHLSRRTAFTGVAGLGVGAVALSACGGDSDTASDPASEGTSSPSDTESSSGSESPSSGGGEAVAATSDIPVGGCAVFADQKCVITQPSEGDFKAFTSVCTHQGCTVSAGTDGVIPCACHGSQFSLEDGSVIQGPATAPLSEVSISVEGDSISLA
ncbi:Rieske (2Fe-2S) protein [Nocardioides currus]|uniref:Cytochrome bc1 complex Rieske iron-sulfur subunit n=1 Tax=Nocardioides currus TaxID=2133958 RepID=A0A2R7YUD2_9ACTN|nr:Rieske (2Fe-2S) protein [Nocardioides currus]PUA80007.1 hypothetical protein C7S10_15740 [Nocardioides currus]